MLRIENDALVLEGPAGCIRVPLNDEITRRLAMLYEGQCEGAGPTKAARKYGFSRQRYFQILHAFEAQGAAGLALQKRGPKAPSRRTEEVKRQVIRHRFLDRDASTDVIAQKLRQCGMPIAARTVQRVIQEFHLQKKTSTKPLPRRPNRS